MRPDRPEPLSEDAVLALPQNLHRVLNYALATYPPDWFVIGEDAGPVDTPYETLHERRRGTNVPTILTPEQEAEVVVLARQGMTRRQLCRHFHCSHARIVKLLTAAGIGRQKKRSKLSAQTLQSIRTASAAGATTAQLAITWEISPATVRLILRRHPSYDF